MHLHQFFTESFSLNSIRKTLQSAKNEFPIFNGSNFILCEAKLKNTLITAGIKSSYLDIDMSEYFPTNLIIEESDGLGRQKEYASSVLLSIDNTIRDLIKATIPDINTFNDLNSSTISSHKMFNHITLMNFFQLLKINL